MVIKSYSGAVSGVDASLITIEVTVVQGTHFYMVGLPGNAIKESQQRIESTLKHMGCYMPRQKVIINLAPAELRKEGTAYDLPIALGILQASGQYNFPNLGRYFILGELSLDGYLRPVKGILPMTAAAKKHQFKGIILPMQNANEAAAIDGIDIIPVKHIKEAIHFFTGKKDIPSHRRIPVQNTNLGPKSPTDLDFSDVQGQKSTKLALEIAAAGGHNVLMIGPPGAGKTMLAKRMPSILPPLSTHEALETTKIYSVVGKVDAEQALIEKRPFRSPHHTISDVALVGGGGTPQPGEISLAHHGILFLDELPEFKRTVLEVMRQPLEERQITISRAKQSLAFPANFMLIASMNPCPCGYHNTQQRAKCRCSAISVQRYLNKISGPLLDRIDLHLDVSPVPFNKMISTQKEEESDSVRARVIAARKIQAQRFVKYDQVFTNADMPVPLIKQVCKLKSSDTQLLKDAVEKMGLSSRAYNKVLKVARTIADLNEVDQINTRHLVQAIHYRKLDRLK